MATSLVLLSTLLVGILAIQKRHVRQITRAEEARVATELADELIAGWFNSDEPLPFDIEGGFSRDGYSWTCESLRSQATNPAWNAKSIRLSVFGPSSPQPLFQVELLSDQFVEERQNRNGTRVGGLNE